MIRLPFVILFTIGCFCAAAMAWQQQTGAFIWPPSVVTLKPSDHIWRDYTTQNNTLPLRGGNDARPGKLYGTYSELNP